MHSPTADGRECVEVQDNGRRPDDGPALLREGYQSSREVGR